MNAKDTALKLRNEYYQNLSDVLNNKEADEFASTCALIAANLVQDSVANVRLSMSGNSIFIKYWENVKDEICKL